MRSEEINFCWIKCYKPGGTHLVNLERSLFKQIAAARGFSTTMKRLVSSAKRQICEPIALTISLKYNKNSIDPKIYPWGTPASIYT